MVQKATRPIDGIDLMPLIRGEVKDRDRDLFFGYRRLHQGIDGQSIISGDWKLLQEAKKNGRLRLYDLSKDPFETQDLSEEMPEQTEQLRKQLEELQASCQRSRDGGDYRY